MKDALRELEFPGHASIDPARSAMIGFSFGGLLATMLAALAAEEGLPVPQALFLSAPCTENGWCLDMPDETPILPKGLKATIIAYDDDFDIGDAPKLVWEALASLPDDDRDFVMMRTDSHGRPVLWARHETTYQEVDAADWYGVWKLSDALLACAFFGEWCEYALGNTPEQRFMGTWSDGIAVKELVVTDDPAEIS
jgi:pimeloyl-ACP methyl ester carboxylesterase